MMRLPSPRIRGSLTRWRGGVAWENGSSPADKMVNSPWPFSGNFSGSLGLLFLTKLRGWEIILAKLAATSLNSFFVLLSIFPVLGLALLFGGVTGIQFWHAVVGLTSTLFFSLCLGLLVSAVCEDERSALLATLLCQIALVFGLPFAWRAVGLAMSNRPLDYLLLYPSPLYFSRLGATGVNSDFWPATFTLIGMGLAFLVAASVILPTAFHNHGRSGAVREACWRRIQFGDPGWRQRRRDEMLCSAPFRWLAGRDRSFAIMAVLYTGMVVGFCLWTLHVGEPKARARRFVPVGIYGTLGLHLLLKFLVVVETCRQFIQDKRVGALELLVCAPARATLMLSSQRQRLQALCIMPAAALGLQGICLMGTVSTQSIWSSWPFALVSLTAWPDTKALIQVGMLHSLEMRTVSRASVASLACVLVPPWLAAAGIATLFSRIASEPAAKLLMVGWFAGVVLYDRWLVREMSRTLRFSFRQLAANDRHRPIVRTSA